MKRGMREELGQGPEVVARLLETARGQVWEVARAMRQRPIDSVVIAARGTSDHAAVYAQYILGARNRLTVALAAPSLVTLYNAPPVLHNAMLLGISQSGQSPDVVAVLDEARRQGALTVAITNDPTSQLAAAADHVIDLAAGHERAVPATKTYLAEIALIAMLSAALSGDEESWEHLGMVPDALRKALETEPEAARLAHRWVSLGACAVLARGFQYATAREWALKLKEAAYVDAESYSAADFQHGPMALVDDEFAVLAVATSGPALRPTADLLHRLADASARVLILSDDDEVRGIGDGLMVPLLPEWLSPLAAIVPGQMFAFHLAVERGVDADSPRHLTKVTHTR